MFFTLLSPHSLSLSYLLSSCCSTLHTVMPCWLSIWDKCFSKVKAPPSSKQFRSWSVWQWKEAPPHLSSEPPTSVVSHATTNQGMCVLPLSCIPIRVMCWLLHRATWILRGIFYWALVSIDFFHVWSDCHGDPQQVPWQLSFTKEHLLLCLWGLPLYYWAVGKHCDVLNHKFIKYYPLNRVSTLQKTFYSPVTLCYACLQLLTPLHAQRQHQCRPALHTVTNSLQINCCAFLCSPPV